MLVQDFIRSCLLRELTASQLVAIATRSDTGSHNRLDLIQSLVPPHYVCNGYVSNMYIYYWHFSNGAPCSPPLHGSPLFMVLHPSFHGASPIHYPSILFHGPPPSPTLTQSFPLLTLLNVIFSF